MSDDEALAKAIRRGPPITVKCECGERREMRYGEQWKCEECGRRYDTNKIPAEEYAAFHRAKVRDRIVPGIVFAFIAVLIVVFVIAGKPLALVLIIPTIGFIWGSWVRPRRRRRQYKAVAERPRWQIRAD